MGILERNINFIAWENFARWEVYSFWIQSLALCFLFVWICLAAGRTVAGKTVFSSATEELVLNVAVGSGVLCFAIAVLLLTGCLKSGPVILLLLFALSLNAITNKDPRIMLYPPKLILKALIEEKYLWILFGLSSLPALLPPYRWDEMSYHLPYVKQWVAAGGITVDPGMIFPLYTFNFHTLQCLGMMIKSEAWIHFLPWIMGCLASLTILVFLRRLRVPGILGYVATLAFFLSPIIQRYLTVGHLDVPLMYFMAVSVFAIYFTRQSVETRWFFPASALICAMFIGIKNTGFFFIPLFLALAKRGWVFKKWMVFVVIFLSFGSIWYIRNIILSGDPVPPLFNMLFHRKDSYWTQSDFEALIAELTKGLHHDPVSILSLPYQLIVSTEDGTLRDRPFLGFMLIFPMAFLLLKPLWKNDAADPVLACGYAAILWIGTAFLARYAHFAALAAVCSAVVLNAFFIFIQRRQKVGISPTAMGLVATLVLIGPTLSAARYYKGNFSIAIPVNEKERVSFLEHYDPDGMEGIHQLKMSGINEGPIYSLGYTYLKYYFNEAGYQLVGNYVHQYGYGDFKKSLENRNAKLFLKETGAKAMIVNKKALAPIQIKEELLLDMVKNEPGYSLAYNGPIFMIIKLARP